MFSSGALLPGRPALSSCLLSPARPQRHGLAVCLALTTMCTSLLLVYSSLGGQKDRPSQQQQAAATGSAQPSAESSPSSRPGAPAGPRPLDGYLGVADHKVTAGSPTRRPPSRGIPVHLNLPSFPGLGGAVSRCHSEAGRGSGPAGMECDSSYLIWIPIWERMQSFSGNRDGMSGPQRLISLQERALEVEPTDPQNCSCQWVLGS